MANSLFEKKRAGHEEGAGRLLPGFMTMDERNFPGCIEKFELSMSGEDLRFCVEYFRDTEQRDPTAAELWLIDSCLSGGPDQASFDTVIDSVTFSDTQLERAYIDYLAVRKALGRDRPVTLRDIGEMASRYLRGGLLPEGSGRADGFTLNIDAEIDGEKEPWLLHVNNGTETLSGRAYPYAVMRLAAEADNLPDGSEERGCATCTGLADIIYHPGYSGCRIDAGLVLAAAPAVNFRDEEPAPGDIVVLLGGCGGAAEEHRLHSFLRSATVTRMIKKCAVIGETGTAAAVTGLADGLEIDLDPVLERDGGLFCVVSEDNIRMFSDRVSDYDLSCERVAVVTGDKRLVMQLSGEIIIDLSTGFLSCSGSAKHTDIAVEMPENWQSTHIPGRIGNFGASMKSMAEDMSVCSRRGLTERYDTSAGAGTVTMPFGGRNQLTQAQAMVCRLPLERGRSEDCTMASWGFDPYIAGASPYHAGYLAVVDSAARLVASGASAEDIFLSIQGSFASPGNDPVRWGRAFAAMLGAFEAQLGLKIGAESVTEKWIDAADPDKMPATLISRAGAMAKDSAAVSPEFKGAGHEVVILRPYIVEDMRSALWGLPDPASLLKLWETVQGLLETGEAVAAYAPGRGGIGEAIMKMSFGNGIGFRFEPEVFRNLFAYNYGSIILELDDDAYIGADDAGITRLGETTDVHSISLGDESLGIGDLLMVHESRLESVFPTRAAGSEGRIRRNIDYRARSWHAPVFKRAEPKVLMPVFETTGCEAEAARAIREAGAVPGVIIIKNGTPEEEERSAEIFAGAVKDAQMIFVPGSIAGCDDAASRTAFFRNEAVKDGVMNLLDRHDGLICATGSGFATLLELGLIPYGRYADEDDELAVLTKNMIGLHRSAIVRVRISSNKSPWLRYMKTGEILSIPVSTGAGRFEASPGLISHLSGAGQIATQYVDLEGKASGDIRFDPCGSLMSVEGATSPDGRVFGRTGLAERCVSGLYRNVEGAYWGNMFESAVKYFK